MSFPYFRHRTVYSFIQATFTLSRNSLCKLSGRSLSSLGINVYKSRFLTNSCFPKQETDNVKFKIGLLSTIFAISYSTVFSPTCVCSGENNSFQEEKSKKEENCKEEGYKHDKVNFEKPELELLKYDRMIFLTGSINDETANKIVLKLFLLDKLDKRPIQFYINSGGGKITSGLAIYDAMQSIESPVHTVVIGRASSMAAVLAAAGEPGYRKGYEHSRIMVHEASNSISHKQVSDIVIRTQETIYQNEVIMKLLSVHTKKEIGTIQRDKFMSAEEAVEFGIFDDVIKTTPSPKKPGRL